MRNKLLTIALATASLSVHAESFFQVEAGLGAAHTKDVGDGTWIQYQMPHEEKLNSPVYVVGVTGPVFVKGVFSLRYHIDYTYIGNITAGCVCVSDADYSNHHYASETHRFSGFGHIQGVSFTLEPGYEWHGFRFAVEAGPWIFWETWHEYNDTPWGPDHLSHKATPQLGWVAGASVSRGPFTLAYRYYNEPQKWNPYPGIQGGTHMLMMKYTF